MTARLNILLCADLDRTLLPNGIQEESPRARPLLHRIALRPEVTLAYVTGRHKGLVTEAIEEFDLPLPHYVIGDVGTTIYAVDDGGWVTWEAWSSEIAPDWRNNTHDDIGAMFNDIDGIVLQEAGKQNTFKVSYYAATTLDHRRLMDQMQSRLAEYGIEASLVWSIDEPRDIGLLDILPKRATKLHAMQFLMREKGFDERHTVFAGDSGNDLPVLTSGMQAVLVRNASEAVRQEAISLLKEKGCLDRLYVAHGGFLNMNGNYSAGVLEGLVHFIPQARDWMTQPPSPLDDAGKDAD